MPAVKSLFLWGKTPKASSHLCHPLDKHSTFPLRPETASFVSDYIKAHPDLESDPTHIIEGWGWDHASWDVEKMPTWRDLDAYPLIKGHPVILQSRDGHAIWVSRATLDANAPFPDSVEGGVILRDENGEPTGVFIDNAQELIKHPILTDDDLYRRFKTTVDHSLQHGLTSLHDAGFKPDSLAFFRRQTALGPLPIRIYGMTYFDENGPYWGNQITPLVGTPDDRLTARSVKIFADGALRTGGAALYEPYADNPSTCGQMRLPDHVFHAVIPQFLEDGWQVNVHAIGDRANGVVLDAFEEALKGANSSALRPRLEHAQIMTKEDMARLGRLGVIASIQPTHVISDMWFAEPRLVSRKHTSFILVTCSFLITYPLFPITIIRSSFLLTPFPLPTTPMLPACPYHHLHTYPSQNTVTYTHKHKIRAQNE